MSSPQADKPTEAAAESPNDQRRFEDRERDGYDDNRRRSDEDHPMSDEDDEEGQKRRRTFSSSPGDEYGSPAVLPPPPPPHRPQIDRNEICPALIRVFTLHNDTHTSRDFAYGGLPGNEVTVHFWPDTDPKELVQQLKGKSQQFLGKGLDISVSVVYLTTDGTYRVRHLFDHSSENPEYRSLGELGVEPGDFLSVNIVRPGVYTASKRRPSSKSSGRKRSRGGEGRRGDPRDRYRDPPRTGDYRPEYDDRREPPRDRDDRSRPPPRSYRDERDAAPRRH